MYMYNAFDTYSDIQMVSIVNLQGYIIIVNVHHYISP